MAICAIIPFIAFLLLFSVTVGQLQWKSISEQTNADFLRIERNSKRVRFSIAIGMASV
jgi:hypothetical protein